MYDNIRKYNNGQGHDLATGGLLDHQYLYKATR